MEAGLIGHTLAERARSTMWFGPAVAMLVAACAAEGLARVGAPHGSLLAYASWAGSVDAAQGLLTLLASSVITVTSLTFSLAVVALQLASSTFSPRLLRTFVRKPVFQATLAIFLATFVYCLTAIRHLTTSRAVPHVAMLGALVLGVVSIGALVWFITRILTELRVEAMMSDANRETKQVMRRMHPLWRHGERGVTVPDPPDNAVPLRARRSGFVQAVDPDGLVPWTAQRDAIITITVFAGERVTAGVPFGLVWRRDPAASPLEAEEASRQVFPALEVGFERTPQQDVAFGFRQLEDISIKAMSPAINDPATATHAIGHMADLLCELAGRQLGPHLSYDAEGVTRVIVPRREFPDFLDVACGQIRRFGAGEPLIVEALLTTLRDVGTLLRDGRDRAACRRQIDRIERAAQRRIEEEDDLAHVRAVAATARQAVEGGQYAQEPFPVS